jgi:hypothetical protein
MHVMKYDALENFVEKQISSGLLFGSTFLTCTVYETDLIY